MVLRFCFEMIIFWSEEKSGKAIVSESALLCTRRCRRDAHEIEVVDGDGGILDVVVETSEKGRRRESAILRHWQAEAASSRHTRTRAGRHAGRGGRREGVVQRCRAHTVGARRRAAATTDTNQAPAGGRGQQHFVGRGHPSFAYALRITHTISPLHPHQSVSIATTHLHGSHVFVMLDRDDQKQQKTGVGMAEGGSESLVSSWGRLGPAWPGLYHTMAH